MNRWNYNNDPGIVAPTIFKIWYDSLESYVWHDELRPLMAVGLSPHEKTLVEALLRDTAFSYLDDQNTNARETLTDAVTSSFKAAVAAVSSLKNKGFQSWAAYKNTTVYHLLGQQLLPFARGELTDRWWLSCGECNPA